MRLRVPKYGKNEYLSVGPFIMMTANEIDTFLNVKSKRDLAAALHEPYRRFTFLVYAKDPNKQYNTFEIAKGYKKSRTIDAPATALKNIQKKLSKLLAAIYKPRHPAHAFIANKSIVTNAQIHLRAKSILKIDLTDFFGSINFGRVQHLFMAKPFNFPYEVSTCIARICCKDGKLPQGAPTSPVVSNMICLKLDAQLNRFAKNHRINYTRYADDITLSTNQSNFPNSIIECDGPIRLGTSFVSIIQNNGFLINSSKTKLCTGTASKYITGVKVNTILNTSRRKIREVRAMLHALRKFGPEKALAEHLAKWSKRRSIKKPSEFVSVIRGKLSFISMIKGKHNPVTLSLRSQLDEYLSVYTNKTSIDYHLHDKNIAAQSLHKAIIYTEGKTDRIHLAAAFSRLKKKGLFQNLRIIFYSNTWGEGGSEPIKYLCYKSYLGSFSNIPRVVIFDRDVKLSQESQIKLWANNLWSIILPIPLHRSFFGDSLSIEHYYNDTTLYRKDSNGRRLFTVNQFDIKTSHLYSNNNIKSRKSLRDKKQYTVVDDVIDNKGNSIGLSKRDFACAIASGKFPLANEETYVFKQIFDQIEFIINNNTTS